MTKKQAACRNQLATRNTAKVAFCCIVSGLSTFRAMQTALQLAITSTASAVAPATATASPAWPAALRASRRCVRLGLHACCMRLHFNWGGAAGCGLLPVARVARERHRASRRKAAALGCLQGCCKLHYCPLLPCACRTWVGSQDAHHQPKAQPGLPTRIRSPSPPSTPSTPPPVHLQGGSDPIDLCTASKYGPQGALRSDGCRETVTFNGAQYAFRTKQSTVPTGSGESQCAARPSEPWGMHGNMV